MERSDAVVVSEAPLVKDERLRKVLRADPDEGSRSGVKGVDDEMETTDQGQIE
jgi:hypothetical protein